MVEVVNVYSNPWFDLKPLVSARLVAEKERREAKPRRKPRRKRTHQRRLNEREATELIGTYLQGAGVKELSLRFGVHRHTITALLRRYGVELQPRGMKPEDVESAALLYRDGWSLARLGKKFGFDGTTVWRALKAAGAVIRSPNQR